MLVEISLRSLATSGRFFFSCFERSSTLLLKPSMSFQTFGHQKTCPLKTKAAEFEFSAVFLGNRLLLHSFLQLILESIDLFFHRILLPQSIDQFNLVLKQPKLGKNKRSKQFVNQFQMNLNSE